MITDFIKALLAGGMISIAARSFFRFRAKTA